MNTGTNELHEFSDDYILIYQDNTASDIDVERKLPIHIYRQAAEKSLINLPIFLFQSVNKQIKTLPINKCNK
jgi:hypothetical protein